MASLLVWRVLMHWRGLIPVCHVLTVPTAVLECQVAPPAVTGTPVIRTEAVRPFVLRVLTRREAPIPAHRAHRVLTVSKALQAAPHVKPGILATQTGMGKLSAQQELTPRKPPIPVCHALTVSYTFGVKSCVAVVARPLILLDFIQTKKKYMRYNLFCYL